MPKQPRIPTYTLDKGETWAQQLTGWQRHVFVTLDPWLPAQREVTDAEWVVVPGAEGKPLELTISREAPMDPLEWTTNGTVRLSRARYLIYVTGDDGVEHACIGDSTGINTIDAYISADGSATHLHVYFERDGKRRLRE